MTATDTAATPTRTPKLLSAAFASWLGAATVSAVGDGVMYFAIGWVAAGLGGQTAGLTLTMILLPRTLLMLVGGALADRIGLRRAVIACDALMCVALAAYLVVERTAVPTTFLLAGLALAVGVVSAFQMPASGALPRLFVTDDVLPRAMALTGSLLQIARIIGPPVGGVLVGLLGMTGAVVANLVSCLVILAVMLAVTPPYDRPPATSERSALHQITDALRAARRIPGILPLLGAIALVGSALIPMLSLCVPLVARDRGWTAAATGLVEAVWIAGTLTVTLIVTRTGTYSRPVVPLTIGPLLATAGVITIAASPTPVVAYVGSYLMGLGTALFTTQVMPLYLRRTPEGMLARFQSLLGITQAAPMLVTHNAFGTIAATISPTHALIAVAAITALAALVILSSPTLRTTTTQHDDTHHL